MDHPWREAYRNAMLELDPKKLHDSINRAEAAIALCQKALLPSQEGAAAEIIALRDALDALKAVRPRPTEPLGLGSLGCSNLNRHLFVGSALCGASEATALA
jgi:hypothetical protein